MSYEAVRWAMYDAPMLLTSAGKPDTAARSVLIARAERAGKDGRNTYAGTAELSRVTGYDERTIERAERRLERAGLLIRAGLSPLRTVLWHLDMKQKQADENAALAVERIEKRRRADALRQQKMRDRRKAESTESIDGHGETKIRVTDAESVTSRTQNPDVTDLNAVTSRTQRPPNHPYEPPIEPPGETTPGGAPPPDPRRPPSASLRGTGERNHFTDAPTPAQDLQRKSLPQARTPAPGEQLAPVVHIATWRAS